MVHKHTAVKGSSVLRLIHQHNPMAATEKLGSKIPKICTVPTGDVALQCQAVLLCFKARMSCRQAFLAPNQNLIAELNADDMADDCRGGAAQSQWDEENPARTIRGIPSEAAWDLIQMLGRLAGPTSHSWASACQPKAHKPCLQGFKPVKTYKAGRSGL